MRERPLPDLEFSNPDKIAEFLGKGWERSPESLIYYQFTYTEKDTQRELQLSFPTYPGGMFMATISDGPMFSLFGVIELRLIPKISNFPKTIVVGNERAQFALETKRLRAEFRPIGDSASCAMVNFGDELRRPPVG